MPAGCGGAPGVDELGRHVVTADLLEPNSEGEPAHVGECAIEPLGRYPEDERPGPVVLRVRGEDEPSVLLGDEGQVADRVAERVVGNDDADAPVADDLREVLLLAGSAETVHSDVIVKVVLGPAQRCSFINRRHLRRLNTCAAIAHLLLVCDAVRRDRVADLLELVGRAVAAATRDESDRAGDDDERGGYPGHLHPHLAARRRAGSPPVRPRRSRGRPRP